MTEPASTAASQAEDYVEHVSPLTNQFLPAFFKLASVQPGERVLDLACGPGDSTIEAALKAREIGEVLGIDSLPEFVALARRRALEAGLTNVRFEVMDACALDLGSSYWDVVICHLGITELSDPKAALAEVQRVLRPVGRLALSTWGEWQRSPWLAIPFDAAHAVVPARPPSARAEPFRYGQPGVLSNLLSAAEYQDVTPDRTTAALEYDAPEQYWQAIERGLAYGLSPTAGLHGETLAAVREAAEPALRRWRHPRTHQLRLPAQAFLAVAVK
jgi:SAM-dependent methyltransferase